MLFKNFRIILRDRIFEGDLLEENGRIKKIGEDIEPENHGVTEGYGRYLSPGYIDTHIHGAGGCDTMDASFTSLETISRTVAASGTTSFLPTTMTEDPRKIKSAFQSVKNAMGKVTGAKIIGVHMEGPYISTKAPGAQDGKFIRKPSAEDFRELAGDEISIIKTVTLAPEITGARELTEYLRNHSINASIGHTGATYREATDGIEWGMNHATHLFNAMTGIHHREPGAAGAVLDSDITSEIISDGIHVLWPVLRLAFGIGGTERMILMTDAMMACGMKDGHYSLGGQDVIKKGDEVRLNSGALAGSVLTMEKAVKNVRENTSVPLPGIIRMAALNPAILTGIDDITGEIREGLLADLLILSEDLSVEEVYIEGRKFRA